MKKALKKTILYSLLRNPLRLSRWNILKLYFRKEYVQDCSVRNENVRIGVKSDIEIFRCETYNTKEPETLDWIDQFKAGETFFDIGGNIGVYSLYAGKKGCKVFTFEPESQNFSRLVNNVALNNLTDVRPYCMGIGSKPELTILHITSLNAGDSQHQVGAKSELYDRSYEDIKQGIAVFSVDDLCFTYGLPVPHHIKIDVDGLEPQIIDGAIRVLKDPRVKTLLIEINKGTEEKSDLQKKIESFGFEISVTSKREYRTEAMSARNYIFKKTNS
jgi:FkbM family methyltransferase